MTLAIHFNSLLAIKHNFWITPALIIANQNKFSLKQNKLPNFFPNNGSEKKRQPKKKKPEKKKPTKKTKQEYFLAFGFNVLTFLFREMWEDVLIDEPIINKFLRKYNLIFDRDKFIEFQTQAKFELFSYLIFANNEIKKQILEQEFVETTFTITIENLNEFNYFSLLEDLSKTLLKAKEMDLQKKISTLILMLIGIAAGITAPLQKIHQSLNQVIIVKEKRS